MNALFIGFAVYVIASIVCGIVDKIRKPARKTKAAQKPIIEISAPKATSSEMPLTDRQITMQQQRTQAAREKELKQQLKLKQAISERDYYAIVIDEQREIINSYEREKAKLKNALQAVNTMYQYSRGNYGNNSRAALNDNIRALDEFNKVNELAKSVKPEKAARDIEKLTKAIQAANKRIIQAQRKIDNANMIIEIYG